MLAVERRLSAVEHTSFLITIITYSCPTYFLSFLGSCYFSSSFLEGGVLECPSGLYLRVSYSYKLKMIFFLQIIQHVLLWLTNDFVFLNVFLCCCSGEKLIYP